MGWRLDEIARERELSGMTAPPIINGGWFQAVTNRVRKIFYSQMNCEARGPHCTD
jgi:hypothetical protein